MTPNGKPLSIRGVDPALWKQLRIASLQKGSPTAYCLNSAIRHWLVKHGSVCAQN